MISIIDTIKEILAEEDHISICILYGSAASGRLTAGSDIDIAVAGTDKFTTGYLVDLQLKLSSGLNREVDIIDLKSTEGLIFREIINGGRVVFKKDTAQYAEFIKKAIYINEDILPNIKMILKKRAKRFACGQ